MRCHGLFPFHSVHGALEARTVMWFAIPFPLGTMFYQVLTGRDVHLRRSPRRDDMPGAPVVPRLVLVEPVNLHPLPGLNLGAAWAWTKPCWSRREEGGWVPRRLELGSEDAPPWSASRPRCSRWPPRGHSAPAGPAAGRTLAPSFPLFRLLGGLVQAHHRPKQPPGVS